MLKRYRDANAPRGRRREIVIDASTLVRGLLGDTAGAGEIVGGIWDGTIKAHAPDLIGPESTHALLRLVRAGYLS